MVFVIYDLKNKLYVELTRALLVCLYVATVIREIELDKTSLTNGANKIKKFLDKSPTEKRKFEGTLNLYFT